MSELIAMGAPDAAQPGFHYRFTTFREPRGSISLIAKFCSSNEDQRFLMRVRFVTYASEKRRAAECSAARFVRHDYRTDTNCDPEVRARPDSRSRSPGRYWPRC